MRTILKQNSGIAKAQERAQKFSTWSLTLAIMTCLCNTPTSFFKESAFGDKIFGPKVTGPHCRVVFWWLCRNCRKRRWRNENLRPIKRLTTDRGIRCIQFMMSSSVWKKDYEAAICCGQKFLMFGEFFSAIGQTIFINCVCSGIIPFDKTLYPSSQNMVIVKVNWHFLMPSHLN